MDSMRHLSTSLPSSTRRRNEADLLSSFKAAALSVTQLYKAAATGNSQAREAGYQDALEDILAYMDTEKIGLNDGEGWNIRRWLLQRIEDTPAGKAPSEDGDESQRDESDYRASSPELRKRSVEAEDPVLDTIDEHTTTQSAPAQSLPTSKEFTFRSTTAYPTNHAREGQAAMDVDHTPAAVRSKAKSRSNHNTRRDARSQHASTLNLNLGAATGGKRKLPYSDFFDISGVTFDTTDRRGKRPRQA